jgi:hypothetical protein
VADGDRVVAASDCEEIRDGWISQPANTLSSLAYVVAGGLLVRQGEGRSQPLARRTQLYGWSVVAVGLGSAAYHGPGGRWSRRAHDTALVALEAVVALLGLTALRGHGPPLGRAVAVAAPLAGLAAHPSTSMAAQGSVGVLAFAAEGVRARRTDEATGPAWARRLLGPVWAAGALAQALGRTGGPWCRPRSWAQPHAAWHVLSALGLWLRGQEPM